MKNKFIKSLVAVLSATAMLTSTAFAADGWHQNTTTKAWTYEQDGSNVTNEWKDSNGLKFYLGDDGIMVTDKVISNDDGTYSYANGTGAQVKNTWVYAPIPDYEDEASHWIFVRSNGKTYESGWKTINLKQYHFTDSIMDYGFLDESGNMIDDDDAWMTAVYYNGTENDGARHTGWLLVDQPTDEDKYDDYSQIWLYFNSNGKKAVDTTKTINGVKYEFDENGVMVQEWSVATASNATSSDAKYYSSNGSMVKNGWVFTTPEYDDNADEEWFYFSGNGKMLTSQVKKINGKYYAFDENGVMLTGFVQVDEDGVPTKIGEADDIIAEDLMALDGDYMYFTERDRGGVEGAAYTGKSKVDLSDDTYTIMFSTKGESKNQLKQDGYLYINGVLQDEKEEGDYNYRAVEIEDGKYLIVNKAGKILTKKASDKDNTRWVFEDGVAIHVQRDDDTKKYNIVLDTYDLF